MTESPPPQAPQEPHPAPKPALLRTPARLGKGVERIRVVLAPPARGLCVADCLLEKVLRLGVQPRLAKQPPDPPSPLEPSTLPEDNLLPIIVGGCAVGGGGPIQGRLERLQEPLLHASGRQPRTQGHAPPRKPVPGCRPQRLGGSRNDRHRNHILRGVKDEQQHVLAQGRQLARTPPILLGGGRSEREEGSCRFDRLLGAST
eukprot:CAMPEP_0169456758 /NCGR_PEP_ID=MMETSP1042-20121227/16518_1 /TAXON_ID=464988 /ORGANISM="Hemiselmis andersenii, Strain CCMP1180" /LENGTH=201 /DNA_ID=CAMNT_0009568991 /DNA_START=28 /DNA_END=634 /DNA_ORIENTATION=-